MWWLKAYILLRVCYLGDCTPNNWSALWYFALMLSYVIIVLTKVTSVLVWIKWFRCQLPQLATFYSFLKRTYMIECPNIFVCPHCSKQSIIVCPEIDFHSLSCVCLYQMLCYIKFGNLWLYLYYSRAMPFYKWKNCWKIVSVL